jgi:RNA polymerase sigma-70 factor, ECF subfamily
VTHISKSASDFSNNGQSILKPLSCNFGRACLVLGANEGFVADDEQHLHALMIRAQTGDGPATHALLTALAPKLRGFFRGKGAGKEDSEDLVQETLIAIYTKRDMFDSNQKLLGWVYAIARYRMIDRWRHTKRRGQEINIDLFEQTLPAPINESGDPTRDIARLLSSLPQKQRAAIELVKLKDMSIQEAADATGWSVSDVKISIHRGLKALMELVGDREPKLTKETTS